MCDAECNMYTLNPERQRNAETNPDSEFELCSDRMNRLYPMYDLDNECRFQPNSSAETINFDYLKALLLSKDLTRYAELEQITSNDKCVFLDAKVDLLGERVAFQSFVRSGNTFLRKYIE